MGKIPARTEEEEMVEARRLRDHDADQHEKHLCELVANRQMATVAELAKNPEYICAYCGRVAAKAENLCEPVRL
jgi:hypothetical protein